MKFLPSPFIVRRQAGRTQFEVQPRSANFNYKLARPNSPRGITLGGAIRRAKNTFAAPPLPPLYKCRFEPVFPPTNWREDRPQHYIEREFVADVKQRRSFTTSSIISAGTERMKSGFEYPSSQIRVLRTSLQVAASLSRPNLDEMLRYLAKRSCQEERSCFSLGMEQRQELRTYLSISLAQIFHQFVLASLDESAEAEELSWPNELGQGIQVVLAIHTSIHRRQCPRHTWSEDVDDIPHHFVLASFCEIDNRLPNAPRTCSPCYLPLTSGETPWQRNTGSVTSTNQMNRITVIHSVLDQGRAYEAGRSSSSCQSRLPGKHRYGDLDRINSRSPKKDSLWVSSSTKHILLTVKLNSSSCQSSITNLFAGGASAMLRLNQ